MSVHVDDYISLRKAVVANTYKALTEDIVVIITHNQSVRIPAHNMLVAQIHALERISSLLLYVYDSKFNGAMGARCFAAFPGIMGVHHSIWFEQLDMVDTSDECWTKTEVEICQERRILRDKVECIQLQVDEMSRKCLLVFSLSESYEELLALALARSDSTIVERSVRDKVQSFAKV